MPKLWNDTIAAHRHEVSDAILETTLGLVAEQGLRSVTMLQIAEKTGIGRATLYKYFPDVEAILSAWHERHVDAHLKHLAAIRDQPGEPVRRLERVLEAYALIQQEHQGVGAEVTALLHRGQHVVRAQQHLSKLIRDLVTESAKLGEVRRDVPAEELASYCLRALSGASTLRSQAAARRLVAVTMAGLRSTHRSER